MNNIQDHTLLYDFGNEDYIFSLTTRHRFKITDQALYPLFDLSLSLFPGGESDDIVLSVGLEARDDSDNHG
jgi:hypothetical protein